MDQDQFLDSVAQRAGVSRDEAERLTRATMVVLADRISGGEARRQTAQQRRTHEQASRAVAASLAWLRAVLSLLAL